MEEVKYFVNETLHAVYGIDDDGNNTINQYSIIKKIGQGTFGKVKLCKFGDKYFALKVYSKAFLQRQRNHFQISKSSYQCNSALQGVFKEIALMKKFRHQNILRLYEVIDDEVKGKIYMIIDYCEKGPIME